MTEFIHFALFFAAYMVVTVVIIVLDRYFGRPRRPQPPSCGQSCPAENKLLLHMTHMRDEQAEFTARLNASVDRQTNIMQALVDMQRGVINTADSIRIIEDHMLQTIAPEFCRIGKQSIELNDYRSRARFVEDRVRLALTKIVDRMAKELPSRYNFSVKVSHFLPMVGQSGVYKIVDDAWAIIEAEHKERYRIFDEQGEPGTGSASRRSIDYHVDHVVLKLRRLCIDAVRAGTDRANDIYRDDMAGTTGFYKAVQP